MARLDGFSDAQLAVIIRPELARLPTAALNARLNDPNLPPLINRAALEELLHQHRWQLAFLKGAYRWANGLNLPYAFFTYYTTQAGIPVFLNIILKHPPVLSSPLLDSLSAGFTVADTSYYLTQFSPVAEAAKDMLLYHTGPSVSQQRASLGDDLRKAPLKTIATLSLFVGNGLICIPVNFVWNTAVFAFLPRIPSHIPGAHALQLAINLFLLITAYPYAAKFSNTEFVNGQAAFPGILKKLFKELCRGNFNKVMTCLVQIGAAVGIRGLIFEALAKLFIEQIGFGIPPLLMMGITCVHGIFAFSEPVIKEYFGPGENLRRLPQFRDLTEEAFREILQDRLRDRDPGLLRILREEPPVAGLMLWRGGIAGFVAYQALLQYTNMPMYGAISLAVIPGILFSILAFLPERERILLRGLLRELAPEEYDQTQYSRTVRNLAVAINWSSGILGVISTLGFLPHSNPLLTAIIAAILVERMFALILFSEPKMRATLKAFFDGLPSFAAFKSWCSSWFTTTPAAESAEPAAAPTAPSVWQRGCDYVRSAKEAFNNWWWPTAAAVPVPPDPTSVVTEITTLAAATVVTPTSTPAAANDAYYIPWNAPVRATSRALRWLGGATTPAPAQPEPVALNHLASP